MAKIFACVAMWDRFVPTASFHRDHSILYALVCEKELSHMGKIAEILIWCARN